MTTATLNEHVVGTAESRFLIHGIDWEGYETLLRLLGDRRSIRVAYDRGTVELMSPSPKHDIYGYLIGRMIQDIAFELGIPIRGTRSTTFRRRARERGIEADDSYYLGANLGQELQTGNLDLDQVAPPDLAIEIEITHSILNRLDIYASLGVPELWRYDGERLIVLLLQPDGSYAPSPTSFAFPFLLLDEFAGFIEEKDDGDDNPWVLRFRIWVREVLLPRYQNPEG